MGLWINKDYVRKFIETGLIEKPKYDVPILIAAKALIGKFSKK